MKSMNVSYSDNAQTRLTLERGQVASTREAHGLAVECVRGTLWITFEDGGRDHVLEPGERIPVKAGGRMVIEALTTSELVFYRQELVAEITPARVASCSSPECWRTFVGSVALPRANFDSAF